MKTDNENRIEEKRAILNRIFKQIKNNRIVGFDVNLVLNNKEVNRLTFRTSCYDYIYGFRYDAKSNDYIKVVTVEHNEAIEDNFSVTELNLIIEAVNSIIKKAKVISEKL